MRTLDSLLESFEGVTPESDGQWVARCPAHHDSHPSLAIGIGREGRVLLHCRAGCDISAVLGAAGLAYRDLFTVDRGFLPAPRPRDLAPEEAEARHRAYTAFLAHLTLDPEDAEALTRRGLSAEEQARRGYRTLTPLAGRRAAAAASADQDLAKVPGFLVEGPVVRVAPVQGLLIPVRDTEARVVALQVRRDGTHWNPASKYAWFSFANGPARTGAPAHCPLPGTRAQRVRVTEGALKADVVSAVDPTILTIAASSVSTWAAVYPLLEALGASVVHLAFDSDCKVKPGPRRCLGAFWEDLEARGFRVVVEDWSPHRAKGLDDLLVSGGRPEILEDECSSSRV